jgi:uncharacterized protein
MLFRKAPYVPLVTAVILSCATLIWPSVMAAENVDYQTLPLGNLQKIAEKGDSTAQFFMGVRFDRGEGGAQKDDKQAVVWYRKAAERGHADAQFNLGSMCYAGHGTPKDLKEAANWYRKAAEQGQAAAQYNLAIFYEDGLVVPQSYKDAAAWYRKAAEQSHATAQYNLGMLYADGRGVPQDVKEAVAWYRKAAEQGLASALNNLGTIYINGQPGIKRDRTLAYMLCSLGAKGGDPAAANNAAALTKALTPRQIEEGQALAAAWKVGTPLPTASKTGQ